MKKASTLNYGMHKLNIINKKSHKKTTKNSCNIALQPKMIANKKCNLFWLLFYF